MTTLDLFFLSTRMFKTRPMRTLLTVLGVSVGIGTVLFLVSLGYGLQNLILNRITNADALLSLDVSAGTSGLISLNQDNLDKISQVNQVAEISPLISISGQMSVNGLFGDGQIFAADPSFFRLSGMNAQQGELFTKKDSYDVVISSAGAKLFNLEPAQIIGKELSLILFITKIDNDGFEQIEAVKRDDKYIIRGVIEDENNNYVFIAAETIKDLGIVKYAQAKVKISGDQYMEAARNKIMDMGFFVSSLSDTIDQTKKIFQIVQLILALFGLVALVVSAIGMFNTMTIALLERINEIGIMRSIGASSADIKKMFIIEAVVMGAMGGIGGVIIGYLGGEITNFGVNLMAKNFGGQVLDLFYRPLWFIGIIIAFSTIISFLTGVYPSIKASRLNPLEALRYK
jgi:putative ABC transport system permease protein